MRTTPQCERYPSPIQPDLPERPSSRYSHPMRLANVQINNYRSIQRTESVDLDEYTVFVGPNNEGKSNLLRATVLGIELTKSYAKLSVRQAEARRSLPLRVPKSVLAGRGDTAHNWERDFPVALQESKPNGQTSIRIELSLSEGERQQFRQDVGSRIDGSLVIRWLLGERYAELDIVKKGLAKGRVREIASKVAAFISEGIDIYSILAVRTHSRAQEVVRSLVQSELRLLENNPQYRDALEKIRTLREPVLRGVEKSLLGALNDFMPTINAVQINTSDERSLLRPDDILVDDGVLTSLRDKGDGVQSLVALSLMQHLAIRSASAPAVILAIEEPEAHLHPDAMHALRATLQKITEKQQVIVTTHNPIFVNRARVEGNVLVERNRARPARRLSEVRTALGVRIYDNLESAELVLLVEGTTDQCVLHALLSAMSPEIADMLNVGRVAITAMGSASKLSSNFATLANQVCGAYAVLDFDDEGRRAVERGLSLGAVAIRDVILLRVPGMKNAEMEDLLDPVIYADHLKKIYGIELSDQFGQRTRKWSDRLEGEFARAGKLWNDEIKNGLKREVAELAAATPTSAVPSHCMSLLRKIRDELHDRLSI